LKWSKVYCLFNINLLKVYYKHKYFIISHKYIVFVYLNNLNKLIMKCYSCQTKIKTKKQANYLSCEFVRFC